VLNIDSCDATVVSLGYVAATSLLDVLLTSGLRLEPILQMPRRFAYLWILVHSGTLHLFLEHQPCSFGVRLLL
jgi:hypothetical protein